MVNAFNGGAEPGLGLPNPVGLLKVIYGIATVTLCTAVTAPTVGHQCSPG